MCERTIHQQNAFTNISVYIYQHLSLFLCIGYSSTSEKRQKHKLKSNLALSLVSDQQDPTWVGRLTAAIFSKLEHNPLRMKFSLQIVFYSNIFVYMYHVYNTYMYINSYSYTGCITECPLQRRKQNWKSTRQSPFQVFICEQSIRA